MNTKKTTLTKSQERYIDENWEQKTDEGIAAEIQVSPSVVNYYREQKGYKKIKKKPEVRLEDKVKEEPKPKMKRPPAVYSNRSHEEVLNYYENLQL
jgi:hypothetical protein